MDKPKTLDDLFRTRIMKKTIRRAVGSEIRKAVVWGYVVGWLMGGFSVFAIMSYL